MLRENAQVETPRCGECTCLSHGRPGDRGAHVGEMHDQGFLYIGIVGAEFVTRGGVG
jgi:hypothetical protein